MWLASRYVGPGVWYEIGRPHRCLDFNSDTQDFADLTELSTISPLRELGATKEARDLIEGTTLPILLKYTLADGSSPSRRF